MIKEFKTEIKPNNNQITMLNSIVVRRSFSSSLNLRNYTASSAGIQVCGESVNLASVSGQVVSVKQKKDKKHSITKFL